MKALLEIKSVDDYQESLAADLHSLPVQAARSGRRRYKCWRYKINDIINWSFFKLMIFLFCS